MSYFTGENNWKGQEVAEDDTETLFLAEKLHRWKVLVGSSLSSLVSEVASELDERRSNNDTSEVDKDGNFRDLGKMFNDARFNSKFVSPETGEEGPLVTGREEMGVIKMQCMLCKLKMLGKPSLVCHIEGKKHRTRLKDCKFTGK